MFERLFEVISQTDSIVIFGHVNPDGDCYGSQIALKESIKATWPNKTCYAVGSGLSPFSSFLGKMDIVDDEVLQKSLAFAVDFSRFDRAEDKRLSTCKEIVLIDHHRGDVNINNIFSYVDTKSSSSARIVYQFIKECGLKINKKIAEALFLGLVTDTGRFCFLEDDGSSLNVAFELFKYGIDSKRIYDILDFKSKEDILFRTRLYSSLQFCANGVLYAHIKKEDYESLMLTPNSVAGLVNSFKNIKGYPIWAMFIDLGDNFCRTEIRSNYYSVVDVANKYGGGGHKLACGITKLSLKEHTIDEVVNDLGKLIKD